MTEHPIAQADEVPVGELRRVEVSGRTLCLARTEDGKFYALDDACPHEGAPLSEGDLVDCEVECPLHYSRFDLTSGAVLGLPAMDDAHPYAVRVDDTGTVLVDIPQ